VKLPELELAPFATQQLQIGAMQKQLGIPDNAHWAMASLTTNASPDDLIALASSRDASGRYGFETRFMGGSGGYFAGGEWRYDANHNQIISVTNSGIKPAEALLTLHYDNGEKRYQMQQTIQPGDQMWVNLSQLVRQRIPDRTGNTLPVDVSSVTYDLRDLTPGGHSLTVGELAVGGAWGFQAVQPPCPECCGQDVLGFSPDPIDLATGDTDTVAIDGVLACNGNPAVLTPEFTVWGSDNTGVAKVSYAKVQAVATGSTTGYANGLVQVPGACGCNFVPAETYVNIMVPPIIQKINPPTGQQGASVQVGISGSGFGSTTGSLTTSAGTQIGVAKGTWSDVAINATFTINSSAAAQSYTVVVTTATNASCPGCQAKTSFYVTAQCNPSVFAPAQTISCDGKTVHEGKLTISGSNEPNVTNTVVSAQSSSVLNLDLQGSPYTDSSFCLAGQICYGQNYIGYQTPGANINWNVQIFCSNSPYPSLTVTPSETITCQ
jgi:hypothetical protein